MIRPALGLAERADAYYFVADLHALTSLRDRERLRRLSREVAAAWLAVGQARARCELFGVRVWARRDRDCAAVNVRHATQ
jgi:tryptophanyl-tRNA synthetase